MDIRLLVVVKLKPKSLPSGNQLGDIISVKSPPNYSFADPSTVFGIVQTHIPERSGLTLRRIRMRLTEHEERKTLIPMADFPQEVITHVRKQDWRINPSLVPEAWWRDLVDTRFAELTWEQLKTVLKSERDGRMVSEAEFA